LNEATAALGIEAISVYVPRHYLDLRDLAEVNGVDPRKYNDGLGCLRMAIPSPYEDPVTMGWEAAAALLENYRVDREGIGLLAVGTESGVDAAKPVAAYLHGLLDLSRSCRTFDTKHACYSATAALRHALGWCSLPANRGRQALVVATDIARYPVGSPGEPTQGAGAVAMLVSDRPHCLQLEPYPEAVYAEQVMDFWRPNYSAEAMVDGRVSVDSYLRALEYTWRQYAGNSGLGLDDYDHLLFHAPFAKMVHKAYRRVCQLQAGAGTEPGAAQFERHCLPAVWACQELGNLYSGSLYVLLAALLERLQERASGARLGLFSYGSGCCAEFFSARVGPRAVHWRGKIGLEAGLLRRQRLDYQTYLDFRAAATAFNRDGSYWQAVAGWGNGQPVSFLGIRSHQRVYATATRQPAQALEYSARARVVK